MSISIIYLILNFFQSALLESHVRLENGQTVCELSYQFPEGSVNKKIIYRPVGSETWTTVDLVQENGVEVLQSLMPDKLYVSQLTWGTEGASSDEHYFRTFDSVVSNGPDFDHYKIIKPNLEKGSFIHELFQGKMSFQYKDQYFQPGMVIGEVYGAQNLLVNRFFIEKNESGIYHPDLFSIEFTWEEDVIYSLRIFDESNAARWINFKFINLENTLSLSISSNAIHVSCDPNEVSIIQFNGIIEGGSSPYEASWTIRDLSGSEVISGPTKGPLVRDGEVPSITIEQEIPYLITLSVFDGCGLFKETNLRVVCIGDQQQENTLFFEPLNNSENGVN